MVTSFFEEAKEQSLVKATIIEKYFWAWSKVMVATIKKYPRHKRMIAYVDLFAGPGRYGDGTKSTPLRVLERAIQDPDLRDMLVMWLNDKDKENTKSLEYEISRLPGIESLRYKPQIFTGEVGDNYAQMFEQRTMTPTLFFVDPWGYKGLSLRLVNSVLKDWGCDCIFFFNYNRINMGLNNDAVRQHMNSLFGEERAERLRRILEPLSSHQRELTIVEELASALKEMGANYVLPFCFKNDKGTRTSHHLIFASKHFRGYEIMKEIMAQESSRLEQGVPSFVYSPSDMRQPLLMELARPLDDLGKMLLTEFAGQRLTMREIYEQHNVGRPYIAGNYKDVLNQLEEEGKILADPPANKRPKRKGKRTFSDKVIVTFPQ